LELAKAMIPQSFKSSEKSLATQHRVRSTAAGTTEGSNGRVSGKGDVALSPAASNTSSHVFRFSTRRLADSSLPVYWDVDLLRVIFALDHVHTLHTTPSSIRAQAASLMSEVSDEAVAAASDDISPWVRYLLFPKAVLRCWPFGDPRYKLGQRMRRKAERDYIYHNI